MSLHGVPQGVLGLPKQQHGAEAGEAEGPAFETAVRVKGTYILIGVFLAAFIVYYFVNWKLLSFVWKIG
jgi:hypothetical protein